MKTLEEVILKNVYQLCEHAGLLSTHHNYDIYDFETDALAFECREEMPALLNTALPLTRFSLTKPFHINITANGGEKVMCLRRHPDFFHNHITVSDAGDEMLWIIHENTSPDKPDRWLAITDAFGKKTGEVVIKDKHYTLSIDGQTVSCVHKTDTKQGLFDTVCNYILNIASDSNQSPRLYMLTFAVALCADILHCNLANQD
jgi:hypothetical protein